MPAEGPAPTISQELIDINVSEAFGCTCSSGHLSCMRMHRTLDKSMQGFISKGLQRPAALLAGGGSCRPCVPAACC